jgi:hypothetical protein
VITVTLFFVYSVINHIFFNDITGISFYLNLVVLIVLLSFIMLLFEKLTKIERKHFGFVKKELERRILDLSGKNDTLKKEIEKFEYNKNKRIGNITKEAELKKIITGFLKNNKEASKLLTYTVETFNAMAAILYVQPEAEKEFIVKETFGLPENYTPASFSMNEGLNGQIAFEGKSHIVEDIPEDYFDVLSGLGQSKPKYLYLLPVMSEGVCVALVELASFEKNDIEIIWNNIIKNEQKQMTLNI